MFKNKILPWILLFPFNAILLICIYWGLWNLTANPLELYQVRLDSAIYHGTKRIEHSFASDGSIILHPGDLVTIVSESKRNATCLATITRYLKSNTTDITYILNVSTRRIVPEARRTIVNQFLIPTNIMPGKYRFYSLVSLACNPMGYLFPIDLLVSDLPIVIEELTGAEITNEQIIKDLSFDEREKKKQSSVNAK